MSPPPAAAAGAGGVWGGFLGHYVLLCGYDAATDEYEMRDPASRRDVCWIKGEAEIGRAHV